MRGFRLRRAGQAGVDALDRGVRLVDVHLDDEFELVVVSHAKFVLASCLELEISAERRFGCSRVTN
jgi:hypothetical protein